ncbi:MAG: hypothetical protein Q9216_000235 [Gyalolechia sp. 2 TL-2023]
MKKTVSDGIQETVLGLEHTDAWPKSKNQKTKRASISIQLTIDPAETTKKTAKGAGDCQPGLQTAVREGRGIEAGKDWSRVPVGFLCILQIWWVFVRCIRQDIRLSWKRWAI